MYNQALRERISGVCAEFDEPASFTLATCKVTGGKGREVGSVTGCVCTLGHFRCFGEQHRINSSVSGLEET